MGHLTPHATAEQLKAKIDAYIIEATEDVNELSPATVVNVKAEMLANLVAFKAETDKIVA